MYFLIRFLVIFYFEYLNNDTIVQFHIAFDGSKPMGVFDREFIKDLGNQLINLKYFGENLSYPFFPDITAEIVEIIDKAEENERSFALKMFGSKYLKITPNTAKNPIFFEFIAPGNLIVKIYL